MRASYLKDGYVVVTQLFGKVERLRLADDLDGFALGRHPVTNPRPESWSDEDKRASVLAVNFPHRVSEVARASLMNAGLVEALSRLAGAHLAHWDGAVKHVQSIYYAKPPGHLGQPWHQDEAFIPTRDRSLTGAWIALDDADVENGCLWVIPGSHRNGYLWPVRLTANEDEHVVSDEAHGFAASDAMPVEVAAGDVVIFNGYLLHCSFRNRSAHTRRALVHHYCNAWSLLPWPTPPRVVDSTSIPLEDNRAVIAVTHDPYADRGYEQPSGQVFLRPF